MSSNRISSGFTLVELLVVMSVLGILLALTLTVLGDFYTSNTRTVTSVVQTGDTRAALRSIENDISGAAGFYSTLAGDPGNGGSSWNYAGTGANSRVLIASAYATTEPANNDADSSRQLVYDATCNTPLLNYMVFFVKDETLFRRTVKNTAARCTTSGQISQRQTCAILTANPACQSTDARLLGNVSSFKVNYYDTPSSTNPNTAAYAATNPLNPSPAAQHVKTVSIIIGTTHGQGTNASTLEHTLRVTTQN